jgi:hypothetical protein
VASQDLVDLLGLLFQRFMSNDLQQLMEFRQATLQARLVGPPSHLEVSHIPPNLVVECVKRITKYAFLESFPDIDIVTVQRKRTKIC